MEEFENAKAKFLKLYDMANKAKAEAKKTVQVVTQIESDVVAKSLEAKNAQIILTKNGQIPQSKANPIELMEITGDTDV